jgi:hypothetical protein
MTDDDITRLFNQSEPPPDAEAIKRIGEQLKATLVPVRPLPSDTFLWAISVGLFAVISFIVALATKLYGLSALSGPQIAVYYGALLIFAGLFARSLVEQMIPGSRRFIPAFALSASAFCVLGILVFLLFDDRSTEKFVALGIPCLRLGCIGAAISGLLGWGLFRRGYLVTPRETITIYGLFAGLVGVAVLALHCPFLNSLHFIVWHLGAMALAGLAGMALGRYADR